MFAAVFNASGRPVDRGALSGDHRIVRGPQDAPHVAFVHSPPATAVADGEWRGVDSLHGRFWLAGRIRLDGRSLLRARLGADARTSDARLCLQAYAAWGESFAQRLAGDFCFALWDGERGRLLALRDQLGVRALFHAEAQGTCHVSDSLDWILATAPLERALDEYWIADFLGIGYCLDFERTAYRRVSRLAPAHFLEASEAGVTLRPYWRLEIGDPLHLRDRRQYGERFRELMALSIADRLPAGKVGISMSGGLDSTTLAACAVESTGHSGRVIAHCTHFERLMKDDEPHFAALAASHLGIELELRAIDDCTYDPHWRLRSGRSAEPHVGVICAHPDRRMAERQAERASVWFFGEGPDNALTFERDPYLAWLVKRREWRHLGRAALLYLGAKGHHGWRETFLRYAGEREPAAAMAEVPAWLDRGLLQRVDMAERLRRARQPTAAPHPWHPNAVGSFSNPIWQALFASLDDEETMAPLVWRHPYLDLRVLEFLLSVPPVPWGRRKLLLRQAMRDRLPAPILARAKKPLAASPRAVALASCGLPALSGTPRLSDYVDRTALPTVLPGGTELDRLISVHALDHWLGQESEPSAAVAGSGRGR